MPAAHVCCVLVTHLVEVWIGSYGLLAVLVLMTLESALVPIPSEVVMTFAGVLAAAGRLDFGLALAAGIVGNVLGSVIAWTIGRVGGRPLAERFGRYVLVSHEDLDRAERWFARHGEPAVIIGRMLPVVRSVIALPAGIAEMPLRKLVLYTFVGSVPFVVALGLAGYWLGDAVGGLTHAVEVLGVLCGVALVALVVGVLARRAIARRNLIASER